MGIIPSFAVEMDIHDVLYLSYPVPEERLRPAVPSSVPYALVSEGKTVLSVVIFHSRDVKASFLPFAAFAYDQVNLRTYVRDPVTGGPAVFFLRSGITSRFVSFATGLLGVPWQPVSLAIDAGYGDKALKHYASRGEWGQRFRVELVKGGTEEPRLFETREEAVRFITGPAVGFYRSAGGLIRFEVRHSVVEPFWGTISEVEFPLLTHLGFLGEHELTSPLHAFVAPHAHFTVFMPPRRISSRE